MSTKESLNKSKDSKCSIGSKENSPRFIANLEIANVQKRLQTVQAGVRLNTEGSKVKVMDLIKKPLR